MEKSEEIKRELFAEGEEVPVLMHSPEVWEHRQAHILGCPSPHERMHSYEIDAKRKRWI
jgi:hypothetical protein